MQDLKHKVVSSEAWPKELRSQYITSEVHSILPEQIDASEIQYRLVDRSNVKEIKQLHEEWFPVYYDSKYFDKIDNKRIFGMGAFWETHLIGIFIGHFKNNYITNELAQKGWLSWNKALGLYIGTIGVVDEARRFGIGTKLIDQAIEWVGKHRPAGEIIYLHVIDYNNAAIKFYHK